MDQSVAKALELGLAFLIFVGGLGYFFTMSQQMSAYIKEANAYEVDKVYSQVASGVAGTGGPSLTSDVGIDGLYFLLMESDLDHIYVDGSEWMSLKKRLEVTPGLGVFEAAEEVRLEVNGLVYDHYSEVMIVDSEDRLVALSYNHR